MNDLNEQKTCTAAERALLDMIACWPNVPALVTMHEDGRYSVSTPEGLDKSRIATARSTASFAPNQEAGSVSHERAEAAARRLISSHFGLADKARITVPPRKHEDDDFVVMAYISQQRATAKPKDQQYPLVAEEGASKPSTQPDDSAPDSKDDQILADGGRRLNASGLPHLGEGGAPLDAIFQVLRKNGLLHRSGGVLLSAEGALRPAPMLFVGLNPGGDETGNSSSIFDNLVSCRLGNSAWDEDWGGEPGNSLLQRRFKQVAELLGIEPHSIPATNVVFTRSRNVASHGAWAMDREAMAEVHKILAETVQPQRLWFMGDPNAAGELLTNKQIEWRSARHKDWSIGHGTAVYAGQPVTLCHTPHLSVWDPTGKQDELGFAFGLST